MDLSFPLAAEAPVGEYTIKVPDLTRTFRVEEYGKSLRRLVAVEKGALPASSPTPHTHRGGRAVNSSAGCAVSSLPITDLHPDPLALSFPGF